MDVEALKPGQRIRVQQMIERRDGDWRAAVEGVVHKVELAQTGSWYAHSKGNKFWLRRLWLQKDDGEISVLNLDKYTQIELVDAATTSDSATT